MKNLQALKNLIGDDLPINLGENFKAFQNELVEQITCDSREINECSRNGTVLFFALGGEHFDGHDFIDGIFQKNPLAIILSEKDLKSLHGRSIQVRDMQKTMAVIAKRFFTNPDAELNLIGVTGTNGKTTTAYLCRAMLNTISKTGMLGTVEYDVCGKIRKVSNTTPEAIVLFRMLAEAVQNGCQNLALEISSHALELKRAYGLEIDVAIFTNLSPDHLDFHGNLDDYFLAKKKLFYGTNGCKPKHSIVNIDDGYGRQLFHSLKNDGEMPISFGFSKDADFKICNVKKNDINGTIFTIVTKKQSYEFRSPLFGHYNLLNMAASFVACMMIYEEPEKFIGAVADFQGVPGRMDKVMLPNGATAFVDYAHTPNALSAAIESLQSIKKRHLIIVFGCGGDRDTTKRAPMTRIANERSDFAIATSDNPRHEPQDNIFRDMEKGVVDSSKIAFVEDRKEAIIKAIQLSQAGDIILVAGKGHETYQRVNDKTFDFDDRRIIREVSNLR
ncbi:MAG: UDP-N-acetylmuramoyl-L-alanyl-D-glutamate--2,6-diaminopimelate ligase [Puniceicoccales bacterium]|jgi:UDP-N-acetylmuramoyl-L-alanyl-D-glutamate--2,6-diaminopimelate ligase|nr:UDP-N-acetylmuramoyl-L-alanyl-D-glutamate--2,6-diaminopimelate ligase [Puniceicoccales bacterium]